jgi:hypothetical protein
VIEAETPDSLNRLASLVPRHFRGASDQPRVPLRSVTNPSPDRGVYRWAWHRSVQHRAKWWIGTVAFSATLAIVGALAVIPTNPTTSQKVLAALGGLAATTILVLIGTYLAALGAAPYEQRNALRRRITEIKAEYGEDLAAAKARVAALEVAPVTTDHARQLRQIAAGLRADIEAHRTPSYGIDADTLAKAFDEHFPLLGELLKIVDGERAAFTALRDRLVREARQDGMGEPPWLLNDFTDRLADVIARRSMQEILQGPFIFDWQDSGGVMYLGDPAEHAAPIFLTDNSATGCEALKEQFERFMRSAEGWPEAAEIRESFLMRYVASKAAIHHLEVAANTDPITSRCFLCGT